MNIAPKNKEDLSYLDLAKVDQDEIVELVAIEKLKLSENRIRKAVNREEIALMAENIKTFGIMQPLEINNKNEIILGTRRFEAAKLACLEKVPVIRRATNSIYEIEKQLVSDLHSKSISLLERAFAFQRLIEIKDMTKNRLAKYLGFSTNLICRTLSILDANKETFNLMRKGKISQRMVATILYRLKDKSKESYVVNKIIEEGLSVAQAENLIAEINDSEVLKKHFLKQVKGFSTSLKKFKEKVEKSSGGGTEEIKDELEKISNSINELM